MRGFLLAVAGLHAFFMLAELFPWPLPFLLGKLSKELPELTPGQSKWTAPQQRMVGTIVHNAGIYNGIRAGGLIWAAYVGEPARDVAQVLLIGAAVAGVYGTLTLRSVPTAVQADAGLVRFVLLSGLCHRWIEVSNAMADLRLCQH